MDAAASAAVGFGSAGVVSFAATPLAIRVARRTNFYDHPGGYHKHVAPTPFLGGAAVLLAVLVAAVAVGVSGTLLLVLGCAAVLWLIGTVDDRVAVPPKWRLLAETGIAVGLYADGLGWHTSLPAAGNVALTIVWVIGIVNAFNLMDNLDGACSSVASVAAAGVGVLAALKGEPMIAGLTFALSGACVGFLPWNLAGPAKIFLGDGGSMPIGFLVAALAMATARHAPAGNLGVLAAALCAGLPILDTSLVVYSRSRRGVPLVTGGRDHLSHRLLIRLADPRPVALALALAQGAFVTLAIVGHQLGTAGVLALAFGAFVAGTLAILLLDTERWRPAGIAVGAGQRQPHPRPATAGSASSD